jgi:heme/copper-type cytochrome/quinol oxidase subunit 1
MNIKNIKVYHLFWFVAVIILLIGIINPNETLDINIHDTYFVIGYLHVSFVLFLFYFLNGFGYWSIQKVIKKQLVKSLTLIHSVILIGNFILYWVIFLYGKLFFTNHNSPLFDDFQFVNLACSLGIVLTTFVALPIYIVNLLIVIFRNK